MNDIIFSHRPVAGVSVGAFNKDDTLYVAFALVNDGTSRNGIFHADHHDSFCRATARAIIKGRIHNMSQKRGMQFVATVPGGPMREQAPITTKFGLLLETDLTARQFIARFRETFKPTIDESDEFLNNVITFGDVDTRSRMFGSQIIDLLTHLTHYVIEHTQVNCGE